MVVESSVRRHFAKRSLSSSRKINMSFEKRSPTYSGIDIKPHGNEPAEMVRAVRDWFVETVGLRRVHSATKIWYRFTDFTSTFYDARVADGFTDDELNMMPIPEYIDFMKSWIKKSR